MKLNIIISYSIYVLSLHSFHTHSSTIGLSKLCLFRYKLAVKRTCKISLKGYRHIKFGI